MGRFRNSYVISGRSAAEVSGQIHRLASLGYDAAIRSGVVPTERREDPTPYLMEQGIQYLRHLESRLEGT